MKRPPFQLSLFSEDTVSVRWAAEHLGVSEKTIRRYCEEGVLEGYQFLSRGWWRVLKSSIYACEQTIRTRHALERGDAQQQTAKAGGAR